MWATAAKNPNIKKPPFLRWFFYYDKAKTYSLKHIAYSLLFLLISFIAVAVAVAIIILIGIAIAVFVTVAV